MALSQATGAESGSVISESGIQSAMSHRQTEDSGPMGFVRKRLRNSVLGLGCVNRWAANSPSPLQPIELTRRDGQYTAGPLSANNEDSSSLEENSTSEDEAGVRSNSGLTRAA